MCSKTLKHPFRRKITSLGFFSPVLDLWRSEFWSHSMYPPPLPVPTGFAKAVTPQAYLPGLPLFLVEKEALPKAVLPR